MDIIGNILRKIKGNLAENKIEFEHTYLNDYIKISLTNNGKVIPISEFDDNEYKYFLETDIFDIAENNNYLKLKYENIYELSEEHLELFGLPTFFNGAIFIDNSTNFLNADGLRYEYRITDGQNEYKLKFGNYISRFSDGKKFFLTKEQYSIIKEIMEYNMNREKTLLANEQYGLLKKIKEISKETNLILNETLRKEDEILVAENIQLDFIKKENNILEIVPRIEAFSDEQNIKLQEEFRKRGSTKDFYSIDFNGKKLKIVINTDIKKSLNIVKEQKSEISEKDFIKREGKVFEIESESIEFNYGPRVIGLGYLNYRPSAPINSSEVDWFYKEFPEIATDPPIPLKPEHLDYLKEKLDSEGEEAELEFPTEDGKKKVLIPKENLKDEIKKLENSIKEITDYKKPNLLTELIELFKNNPDNDYFEYRGNFVKNPKDLELMEKFRDSLDVDEKDKLKKEKEKVLILKDNIEELEYTENVEVKEEFTVEIPASIKENIVLMEHQKQGLQKMQSLYKNSKVNGLLLCDDMGLGKTIQILSFFAWLKENNNIKPSLVIAPTSLITNWYNEDENEKKQGEIQKFFKKDTFRVKPILGQISKSEVKELENYDIVMTSYETLRINHKETGKIKWKVVVCDEAQKMKNPKTLLTTAIKTQNAEFKIACSATPIENNLVDLWCLTDFVKPGLLRSQKEFEKEYIKELKNIDKDDDEERQRINDKLKSKIGEFYIRRTKDELGKDFPKKIIVFEKIEPSEKQEKYMEELYNLRSLGGTPLPIIQGLIMVCSHPALREKGEKISSSEKILIEEAYKLERIKCILEEISIKNEKAIIFTKYRKMQEILALTINYWFSFFPKVINGDDDSSTRRKLLDEYRSKEGFNVIILSPEAAGVGLNIVEANHVIHYTRHWNPAKEEQATDRAYRIGQKKDVYVYYPVITNDLMKDKFEKIVFNSPDEWINAQINDDVKKKSPEEKLNKIIVRKKKMLKDFFLASTSEMDDTDYKEFSGTDLHTEKYIDINDIEAIDPYQFEVLSTIIFEKELLGNGYVTPISGDSGVDGIVLSKNGNILIQCKHTKKLTNEAIKDITYGKEVYEKELNIKFDKLVVITTTNHLSKEVDEFPEKYSKIVEIYKRKDLAELLLKNKTKYSEIIDKSKRYSIEELRKEIKYM